MHIISRSDAQDLKAVALILFPDFSNSSASDFQCSTKSLTFFSITFFLRELIELIVEFL
jgi:hypothetical protein